MTLVSISYIFKAFIEAAIIFIGKGSLAIKKSFKVDKAEVVDNIKGVNRCDFVSITRDTYSSRPES